MGTPLLAQPTPRAAAWEGTLPARRPSLGCGHGRGAGRAFASPQGHSGLGPPAGAPEAGTERLTQAEVAGAERLSVLPVGRGLGPVSSASVVPVKDSATHRKRGAGKASVVSLKEADSGSITEGFWSVLRLIPYF